MDSPEQSGFLKSLSHKIYGTLLIQPKVFRYKKTGFFTPENFRLGTYDRTSQNFSFNCEKNLFDTALHLHV